MTDRRQFLLTSATALTAAALSPLPLVAVGRRIGSRPRMQLAFAPYELKLRHVFTVATHSRSTTPDIQVELHYDGFTGYGEASMPPYLSAELGTVESVTAFLGRAAELLGTFPDPFQLEEILEAVDRLDQGNAAGKALVSAGPQL